MILKDESIDIRKVVKELNFLNMGKSCAIGWFYQDESNLIATGLNIIGKLELSFKNDRV